MRRARQAALLLAGSVAAAVCIAATPVKSGIRVETAVVRAGELAETIWLNGTVQYADEQPYISLKSGTVAGVYVQAGDRVCKGDLLFQMDTTAEIQTLASLYEAWYQNERMIDGFSETAAALGRPRALEWQQLEAQSKAMIEAGQIRASMDGVVEAVYVREGDGIGEGTLLGMSRGTEKQLAATVRSADASLLKTGAVVWIERNGERIQGAVSQIQALPEKGASLINIIPEKAETFAGFSIGETVRTEAVVSIHNADALMPLAAADEDGFVWMAVDGKVQKKAFEWNLCSRTHAQADAEWLGQTVILYPDRYRLRDGMNIQVAE